MALESFARVDAWCARNGRNPYTGMPCPLRKDLGGDGVLVLTPPAYFQEDYAPGPGWCVGITIMWMRWRCRRSLVSGGMGVGCVVWMRGCVGVWCRLVVWMVCWGCGRLRMVVRWRCLRWGVRGNRVWGCFSSRGVVSNRSWASYWFRRELVSGGVLELVLDVRQPGRRRRLVAKAVRAWERCARHTQLLPPDGAAGTQA